MLGKVPFIMMFDDDWNYSYLDSEGINMLGKSYLTGFSIGEYVEWRRLTRNENYEENVTFHQGIITQMKATDMGGRMVYYAEVMENGGSTYWVLLSKIRKVETN